MVEQGLIGNRTAQLESALTGLERVLQQQQSDLSRLVRLEVYLGDISFLPAAMVWLARRLAESPPAVVVTGAELEDTHEVKLNAIAV